MVGTESIEKNKEGGVQCVCCGKSVEILRYNDGWEYVYSEYTGYGCVARYICPDCIAKRRKEVEK